MKLYYFTIILALTCSKKAEKENLFKPTSMSIPYNSESNNFDTVNIENNFKEKNIKELNSSNISSIDKDLSIPYEVISDIFLYPVNEITYGSSYLKSKYYAGYKIKIANNVWILSYLYHFDLHSEKVIWTVYDSKNRQIKSNLIIASWNSDSDKIVNEFDGKEISITTTFKRHFKNGMEGDNSKPIELIERYKLDGNYRFEKINSN